MHFWVGREEFSTTWRLPKIYSFSSRDKILKISLGFVLVHKDCKFIFSSFLGVILCLSIILKFYSPRYPVNITFSWRGRSTKYIFRV